MNMASGKVRTEVFIQSRKLNSEHSSLQHERDVPIGILVSFDNQEQNKQQNVSKMSIDRGNMDQPKNANESGDNAVPPEDSNGISPVKTPQETPVTDDCPNRLQNSAADSFKLCGYLEKLGEKGILKTYKKRWFVFDNQRCMLCYYRSHEFIVPLGCIPVANATFSYNPADSERPGNFSITVEGRVYQLQAEDYQTKMYWLQELQERRRSYSQLRTSLARDSTKRTIMEPTTGLVSTKKMKEKGGDPWAGLPPLLQPIATPIHSVGEETAGNSKGGISFNSIKMDLKNPIEGIRRWKSLHQDSLPPNTQVQTPEPSSQPLQPSIPIPKPRRKHQTNTESATKRPNSILQRFSSSSSENMTDKCPKCSQLLAQISSLQEELEMVDNEAKASQEVTQILHKQLSESKLQQSTSLKFLDCKADQEKMMLLHRKDKQLLQLEQLLHEVEYDRNALKNELRTSQAKLAELEEQIVMFQELLVAKDEIVMNLTIKINDLEKNPPLNANTLDDTTSSNTQSFIDAEGQGSYPAVGDNRTDACTAVGIISPKPSALNIDRHDFEKLKDACSAFQTQNKFLNKEILELNELRTQGQLRENSLEAKLDQMEAELLKLNTKHLLLLNRLKAPRREVNSVEDKDDLVNQLIEEAIQYKPGNEAEINEIEKELYDKYGFNKYLEESDIGESEDQLVTMAAECQRKIDQIKLKQQSDESVSHSVKWENFIISSRNKAFVRTPELKALVRMGIPHEHRPRIWKECVERRVRLDKEDYEPCYYEKLTAVKHHNTSNPAVKQIELDLLRTLPNNKHYDKITSTGIPKLRRVLLAYSDHNPAVGYCQGLNRLAAIALLYLEEEDVFWCLVCVIEHIMPMDYYSKTLVGSQTDQKVLKDLLAEKLPRINAHLDQHKIDLSLVTFNWFITIFCDNIPAETMLRIWDTFLFEGDKVMFRYALAFFKVTEEKLLAQKDYLSIFATLRELPNMMKDTKKISQIAFHDLNPFPRKNIMVKRAIHRQQVIQQLEELEAIRREFVPRHSVDNMICSDDDEEDFENVDLSTN